ncbi:MAG: Hsp20/alpha crystallin family protein [Proteobacteria bacterium]|nr:Hsp20/alpha crystallin family protein [Pseudomonadota bacterium]HOL38290.1 Hsp20/alpha crystallin family protein [Rubrivivax sp.]
MSTVTTPRDESQSHTPAARNEATLLPSVNVIEDAAGITLYADMPGVPKDRVTLRVEDDQLSIEGEMQLALPPDMQPLHAEVQRARYHRAFTLSKELDADQVSAEMNQGVLRVRIPKAAHAQPRRVQVQVA